MSGEVNLSWRIHYEGVYKFIVNMEKSLRNSKISHINNYVESCGNENFTCFLGIIAMSPINFYHEFVFPYTIALLDKKLSPKTNENCAMRSLKNVFRVIVNSPFWLIEIAINVNILAAYILVVTLGSIEKGIVKIVTLCKSSSSTAPSTSAVASKSKQGSHEASPL